MFTIPFRSSLCGKKRGFENHDEYLSRIKKSLYYVNLPKAYCTSLPCTELAAEIFSEINKFSLDQLDLEEAASLSHNACVSPCSLVLALLYVDRLKTLNPKYLKKVSVSELFLISLMVGSKFLQDDGEEDEVNNHEWAASAGITVQDVNRAEKQFLDAIRWEVFVSEEEFWDRFHVLECKLGLRQGAQRGWFTYTELNLLLELVDITTVIQTFCTVTAAFLTSYAASMLTLVGSALLVGQIPGLGLRPNPQDIDSNSGWNNLPYNYTDRIVIDHKTTNVPEASTLADYEQLKEHNELNFCRGFCDENDEQVCTCMNWNSLHLFLKTAPVRAVRDRSSYSARDAQRKNCVKFFDTCTNLWEWADVIRNYLLVNSMPSSILSIANF